MQNYKKGFSFWDLDFSFFSDLEKRAIFAIMKMDFNEIVEQLLETPCWVIDLLPMQVPEGSRDQFFDVESYYLQEPRHELLCRRFADVLLKLNCYHNLLLNRNAGGEWVKNPEPATTARWLMECMHNGHLCALIDDGDALITASGGDTHLTLYNPSEDLLQLVSQLASAAGLFVWKP